MRFALARFLLRMLAGYRLIVLLGVSMTFVQVLADVAVAFPLKFILDKVIDHRDPAFPYAGAVLQPFDRIGTYAGLHPGESHTALGVIAFAATMLVVCGLTSALLVHAQMYLASFVGTHAAARLRRRLFDHLQRLTLDWHGRQRTGDLVQRVTSNVADVEKLVTDGLVDLLAGALTLAGVVTVMLLVNWRFTIVSMVVVPALFATVLGFTRAIKAATRRAARLQGHVADIATEDVRAVIDVKSFTLEERESQHFGERVGAHRAAAWRAGRLQSRFTPLVMVLITLSQATIIGAGAVVATGHAFVFGPMTIPAGSLTVGTLTVYLAYLKQLYQPMRDLSKLSNLASTAGSAAERIQEVLDQAPEVVETVRPYRGPERVYGEVRLRDVAFGYEPGRPVLASIDLTVPAGGRVALVGLSGSGKTTTVKLVPRFYDVWAGQIEVDGRDVRAYPLDVLRRNVSLVLQDAVLFEGTIRDNIAVGRPAACDAEIVEAATRAHIHDTIVGMPSGYAAHVREHGKNLSSGQRQRLAIARAILRDSPILILDEPTANLDVEAEAEVMHAIDTLITGRTVITISHRLSTLGHVDEIVVLADGRIVERGTYDELKREGGVFAWMLDEQSRYSGERVSSPASSAPGRGPTSFTVD